jgi:3-oxoadipyl-CoA thiolase
VTDVVVVEAVRTPFGRRGGALARVRPDDLAAVVLRALVERTRIDPARVDDVILGCANQAGEDNRNVARMAALIAGFPVEVPGQTVNRLCGSGLQAIASAAQAIKAGEAECVIAGGVESMTRAPWVTLKPEEPFRGAFRRWQTARWAGGSQIPECRRSGRFRWARRPRRSRVGATSPARISAYAVESQRRAAEAIASGVFDEEIVQVQVPGRGRGPPTVVSRDEAPRPEIALGHPLGASGARLIGTLARELRRRDARYGAAAMCIGVGQGIAMIIERT